MVVHQWRLIAGLVVLSAVSSFCPQTPMGLSRSQCLVVQEQQPKTSTGRTMSPNDDESNSNEDDSNKPCRSSRPSSRRRRLWKKSKKAAVSLTLALSVALRPTPAAWASDKYDTSARANDILIESLAPGATKEEAELALDTNVLLREKTEITTSASSKSSTTTSNSKKQDKKKPKKKNLYYDDEEDLEVEGGFFGEEELASLTKAAKSKQTLKTSTTSANYLKSSEINKSTYVKALFLFLTAPVMLFSGIETYKRRSESAYVEKALKIQEMKKQEYLNQTAAAEAARKTNETATDDDDDDDDDDDNDDDDNDDTDDDPAPPKKPSGGKPSGSGGGSDDDAPSDDDIARLNKLMGR